MISMIFESYMHTIHVPYLSPIRMPFILARHLPDIENVRFVEIYQRYKLSDTKYAIMHSLTSHRIRLITIPEMHHNNVS